jgi:DNA-binding NarL/FixJ family response regulator
MDKNKTQVVIISQQSLFRQGIILALAPVPDIEVHGIIENKTDFFSIMYNQPPDVVIVDLDIPLNGAWPIIKIVRQRWPAMGVIALTSNYSDMQLFKALKAQVKAYAGKDLSAETLIEIIRLVSQGKPPRNNIIHPPPELVNRVLSPFQKPALKYPEPSPLPPLSPREQEVLEFMARGFLNKQIAFQLNISEQTVKNHVTAILHKLNADLRTEAVISALKRGLVSV